MSSKRPASTKYIPQVRTIHKAAKREEITPEEKSRRLFKSLCAQIDGGHFGNAVKTCDKILRINAKDGDALQAKLFLLLQTEQYDAALSLLESLDNAPARQFERAYALYRLRRESDATAVLAQMKGPERASGVSDRGVLHLEAQLAYRQCAYQDAFDLYSQLLDSSSVDSDEHADLLTNVNASQIHLEFLTSGYLHALDALPASVINGLETAQPPAPPGNAAIPIASAVASSTAVARPEKKVRMSRVPKGVVPGVTPPPDPERWLKKSERSTFGQGAGKRRKAGGGGATQGSVAEVASSHNAKSGGGVKQKKKK